MLCSFEAEAQTYINVEKIISPFNPDSSYYLDEWAIPASIKVTADEDSVLSEKWTFDEISGLWKVKDRFRNEFGDLNSLIISYQALPLTLRRTYQNRKPMEVDSALFSDEDSLRQQIGSQDSGSAFDDSNLNQNGSLSRGIIVGTNQDFALESGLNFELNGQLTDNVTINASLTDQSIPIQPDGTTQNLREFDKVFIQLQAPHLTAEMGDVDLSLEQSTFAKLNRRLQGAAVYSETGYGDYTGAASSVRGTYTSMSFSGEDGVQGPYRLTGRNGEEFVIILAGTERVYVNGQQVQRGAENDYIIDYGLGELTFTSNLLVKDETRIVVEYEYIDQNFTSTLVAAEGEEEFADGRFRVGASVIRKADGDDLLSQQSLTEDNIRLLETVGDNLDEARVSGARVADPEERENFVLYAEVDTTVNGEEYTIFKHISGSPESIYRVSFSRVNEGEGSYERVSREVNGLLYEWVGPGNGNYEPFRELPAPQKQQMVAFNSAYKLSQNVEVFGEWAASDFDQNRFSGLDDGDNTDMAYESGIKVNEAETGIGEVSALVKRRYSGRRFQFFERTREVEFDRKWNIARTSQTKEAINEAMLEVSLTEQTTIGGEFGFVEQDDFLGYRQASSISSSESGIINLNYNQDWVRSRDDILTQNGNWFRHIGRLNKRFESGGIGLTPHLSFEQERRLQRNADTDSLTRLSLSFYDLGPGLTVDVSDFQIEAGIGYRSEKRVLENTLRPQAEAIEQRYRVSYQPGSGFGTTNEIKIRDKQFTEAFIQEGNANRRGLLVKSVSNYTTRNEELDGEVFYQVNTRRQALLQETYIEVGPEIGQYVWDDINMDGVQQVDEFFPEVSPNEGIFVKQYLPSDELFPVIDLNVRLVNAIKPFRFTADENILSDLTLRSRVDITENSTTSNLADIYFLRLNTFRNDSSTIQGRLFWEKELDLFPEYSDADLRLGYNQNKSLNQRSTESLQSFTDLWFFNSSLHVGKRMELRLDGLAGTNRSESDRLQNRNFDIRTLSVTPGFMATVNRSWQAGLNISVTRKEDRLPVRDVTANLVKVSTSHRAYLWKRVQTNLRMEVRDIRVEGNSSAYGNYELTEGTGEGTNLVWSLNSSYRISSLIRFSLNYDGRTVKNRPSIHTIKLVMSATF